jgi:hypothetical protein
MALRLLLEHPGELEEQKSAALQNQGNSTQPLGKGTSAVGASKGGEKKPDISIGTIVGGLKINETAPEMHFVDVICYNCGVPGQPQSQLH